MKTAQELRTGNVVMIGIDAMVVQNPYDMGYRGTRLLKALIEDKKKGHKATKVAEPDDTNVVDLMAALRASLGAKNKAPASKPRARKAG